MEVKEPTIAEVDAQLAKAIAEEAREVEILKRYQERKISRARAAGLLRISERQVNRRLEELGPRETGKRAQIDEQARKRRELRESAAKLVAKGKLTPQQAALRAGCSI